MSELTLEALKDHASLFLKTISGKPIPELYGVNNGKALSSYFENIFDEYLLQRFDYVPGNAASGIDFPELEVDLKITSVRQPQSSSPFRAASQKVYGLGYHLLVFVYDKKDNADTSAAYFSFRDAIFIHKSRTGDFQTTQGILDILERDGNIDDIDAFLQERNLPLDDIGRRDLATRIVRNPPMAGYLTVSNALQWRLQYGRVIDQANQDKINGIENLLP